MRGTWENFIFTGFWLGGFGRRLEFCFKVRLGDLG